MEINRWNGEPYSPRYYSLLKIRKELPVWRRKNAFLDALNQNQVLIVVGEPRAGKSTQIPQFVAEAVDLQNLMICCTQPNRVAAMCLSQRAAEEMDVTLGDQVGYSVPFEGLTSAKTILKYTTDDVLLREAIEDHVLSDYKVIILDEVHQRTQATDLLLGYLKSLRKERTDLKIILLTVDIEVEVERYCHYFDNPPLIRVAITNVPFHVDVIFREQRLSFPFYLNASIIKVVSTHVKEPPGGDILLFLPYKKDIDKACKEIAERVAYLGNSVAPLIVVPLFPELPLEMQQMIFPPSPPQVGFRARRVIVSTDIAETSLPIDNIAYVIDPGYTENRVFRQEIGCEVLSVSRISRESAFQRMCCAGRTREGKCFRLYTPEVFVALQPVTPPKIHESDLASMVLSLKRLDVPGILFFDYLDPPNTEAMMRALYLLHSLGILNEEAKLTGLGHLVAKFPVNPLLGKMLVESCRFNCSKEVLTIAAMLSVPSCYIKREDPGVANPAFGHVSGDHLTMLNLFNIFKQIESDDAPRWCSEKSVDYWVLKHADNVRRKLNHIMVGLGLNIISSKDFGDDTEHYNNIMRALFSGFFLHLTFFEADISYYSDVQGEFLRQCKDDKAQWMIFNNLDSNNGFMELEMINSTSIPSQWFTEFARDVENFPECRMKSRLKSLTEL